MFRLSLSAVATIATVLAISPRAGAAPGSVVVELKPSAQCTEAVFLTRAGGQLVAPTLGLYRVPAIAARHVVAGLRERRALRYSAPNSAAGTLATRDASDPLVPTEWWRAAVGVETLTPPPAGRPVTIVDSGIDLSHPEFLGRPNTEALNVLEPVGSHGTSVASIAAAPVNGLGLVGIYPEARLRSWSAGDRASEELDLTEIVQGILAAANGGPGVVNLSLGSERMELPIEQAIYEAVRKGVLVVASAGNEGARGNQLTYPASIPHVLTVGASDPGNAIARFSSRSRFVDLAAPGVGMPIAMAVGSTWSTGDGTSFAAPLVSGASAWVWTARPELDATQVSEVIRHSATDIGAPGRDDAAGYGLLNVGGALAYPAPISDPLEPNDDIEFVRPGGLYDNSVPPLTTRSKRTASVTARIDRAEDPRDVYRVWLPRQGRITVASIGDAPLDLSLWKQGTVSVIERLVGTDRLARATGRGTSSRLTFANKGPGRFAFLAVLPPRGVREATYRLRVG